MARPTSYSRDYIILFPKEYAVDHPGTAGMASLISIINKALNDNGYKLSEGSGDSYIYGVLRKV